MCKSISFVLPFTPQVMIMRRSSGHHHPCFVYPFSFITSVSDVSLAQAIQTPTNHFHICIEICMGRYNTRALAYTISSRYTYAERGSEICVASGMVVAQNVKNRGNVGAAVIHVSFPYSLSNATDSCICLCKQIRPDTDESGTIRCV